MTETVQRWTGSVQPHERGGFVAYGDYLDLKRALAAAQAENEALKRDAALWQERAEARERALTVANEQITLLMRDAERNLIDRALKMMEMAGYSVAPVNSEHNNPIIAWMADARVYLAALSGKAQDAKSERSK